MTEVFREPIVGRTGLLAAGGLALFALAAVTTARLTGIGETRVSYPAAIETRDLTFADGANGAVLVHDALSGALVETIAPGTDGFIRVVLRGLARDRKMNEIGQAPPFRLTRYANGQMTLTDPTTKRQIDLAAFGAANAAAFTRLMPQNLAPMRGTT